MLDVGYVNFCLTSKNPRNNPSCKKKQANKQKGSQAKGDDSSLQRTQSPFVSHLAYERLFIAITIIFLFYLCFCVGRKKS